MAKNVLDGQGCDHAHCLVIKMETGKKSGLLNSWNSFVKPKLGTPAEGVTRQAYVTGIIGPWMGKVPQIANFIADETNLPVAAVNETPEKDGTVRVHLLFANDQQKQKFATGYGGIGASHVTMTKSPFS